MTIWAATEAGKTAFFYYEGTSLWFLRNYEEAVPEIPGSDGQVGWGPLEGAAAILAEAGVDPFRIDELPEAAQEMFEEAQSVFSTDPEAGRFLVRLVAMAKDAPKIVIRRFTTTLLPSGGRVVVDPKCPFRARWVRAGEV